MEAEKQEAEKQLNLKLEVLDPRIHEMQVLVEKMTAVSMEIDRHKGESQEKHRVEELETLMDDQGILLRHPHRRCLAELDVKMAKLERAAGVGIDDGKLVLFNESVLYAKKTSDQKLRFKALSALKGLRVTRAGKLACNVGIADGMSIALAWACRYSK